MTRAAAWFVLVLRCAAAHRRATTTPSCDGDFGSSATALPVPRADISWSLKHYLDCTHRAVWMTLTNPAPDFKFYVGVGIPPTPRHAALRADAVVIGADLPALTDAELAAIPAEVRADAAFVPRGYLHRSPADQSTCAHLDAVMARASTVRDGRCDFYEPFGGTHSWRVLDADGNVLPTAGAEYFAVVWFQDDVSGKLGIAMGNWVENFWLPFDLAEPTCARDLGDFSEKAGSDAADLPVAACDSVVAPAPTAAPVHSSCAAGALCDDDDDCAAYDAAMGCGGARCPAAAAVWDGLNVRMHEGMALDFSGDASLDFVRGMIPHHRGAVDMCDALLSDLACVTNDDDLDGLVMFCNEVHVSQDYELAGMRRWLALRNRAEAASCADHPDDHAGHDHTADGCGALGADSSVAYVAANRAMHAGMAVDLSCDHAVDFARMMLPHHAGAVAMCDVLDAHGPDAYLAELCANITRTQRAEVAWLHYWLDGRGHAVAAPCGTCADDPAPPAAPCEDMLSASLLCSLSRDPLRCDCAALTEAYACDAVLDETQDAVAADCARTCGDCPTDRPPLFYDACPGDAAGHHAGHGHDDGGHDDGHDDGGHDDGGHDDHGHDHGAVSAAAGPGLGRAALLLAGAALVAL